MSDPIPRPPSEEIRILYVDDDPAFADMAVDSLEREDDRFVVTTASTAHEGLDRLATDAIDCIVSEYELPRMDGIEFLDAVRSMSDLLPFILFTGAGSEDVASAAISAGVTDYLRKHDGPDQLRTMAQRIPHAVERSRERRERRRRLDALDTAETDTGLLAERDRFPSADDAPDDRSGYDPEETDGSHWAWRSPEETVQATTAHGDPVQTEGTTEQTEREREFERTTALLSTLFATLPVGVLAEDGERNVMAVNQRLFDLFDIPGDPSEAIGMDCERMAEESSDLFVDSTGFLDRIDELIAEAESVQREEMLLADGRTFERSYQRIDCPNGDGHLWVYHDSTDQKRYERRLEVLNETTRELMAADSFESIAEIGVTAARDILDLDANAIHLYDDTQSGLVPIAATDALSELVGELPTFTGEDSIAWRVYDRGETFALDDV